ncbi:FecR family protein [Chitinophaga sp.]|uniref:FecR family protein n=1 Tax=Chitinophaga sp. TaxID=1869181 RepID=UPI002F9317D8
MASSERLSLLFDRYLRRACTPDEVKELVSLLQDPAAAETLSPAMAALWERIREEDFSYPVNWQQVYETVTYTAVEDIEQPMTTRRKWWWPVAAAVLAIVVAVSGYLFFISRKYTPAVVALPTQPAYKNDAAPGSHQAVLTLGNGTTIVLNDVQNGVLTEQGGVSIRKTDSSLLTYEANTQVPATEVTYNRLTTPLGGTFRVQLPDGSKVWLNAGSSLVYPVPFTGRQREVVLTGEAYFEVAHNARMPFRVKANDVLTEDRGTIFNIMAYADEAAVKTTLLEGQVIVTRNTQAMPLLPGQQALAGPEAAMKVVTVDTDDVVAWKNGEFSFSHNSIYEIMRQISRWYKVEVTFQGVHDVYLSGNISKSVLLSEVLKMLELAGEVKFKIQDNTVTVIKL